MSEKKSRQVPKPDSNRQRLRAQREAAAKRARAALITRIAVIGVVVVAVIGAVTWAVAAATAPKTNSDTTDYAITIGQDSAPVTVDVYQDFMCSACGLFERNNSTDLQSLLDSGQMKLRIRPVAFFDSYSLGTKYSTRAANDFVTVAKAEPDKAFAFNKLLYANQPSENTTGLTDDQIAQLASQAGVSAATIATFTELTQSEFVTNSTKAAESAGITSTPTIYIDGTQFSGNATVVGPFKQAVLAAAAQQSASASPSVGS